MTESRPEDRSTMERDYRETKRMKQILAGVLIVAIIAFALWSASMGH